MTNIEIKNINLLNLRRTIIKSSSIITFILLVAYFIAWKWSIPKYEETWMNIAYGLVFPLIILV